MKPIPITELFEYRYAVKQGYEPLIDKRFAMDIFLRVKIQRELFGHCVFGRGDDINQANSRFFHWVWAHKRHQCEETMRPLPNYSAVFCSHILPRGAFPEMAHDPRNINILCYEMHSKWENGNREEMRIFPANKRLIKQLKKEYNQLNEIYK